MAFLKQSRDWTRCERCGIHFNLADGGVCRACGRILCEAHLYAGWVQRLRRYVGMRATCADCRARLARGGAPRPLEERESPSRNASRPTRSG